MDSWQAREAELNPKISHQDVLGSEFYCHLLQDNYDLLCKSLILDKSLYAQLLNRCYFTMTMIKHIKVRGKSRGGGALHETLFHDII